MRNIIRGDGQPRRRVGEPIKIQQVKEQNFVIGAISDIADKNGPATQLYTLPSDAVIDRIGFYGIPYTGAVDPGRLMDPYSTLGTLKISIKNLDRVIVDMHLGTAIAILYNKIELNSVFSHYAAADMSDTRIFKLQTSLKDFVGHKLSKPIELKKGDIIEVSVDYNTMSDYFLFELILSGKWKNVRSRRLEYLRTQTIGDLGTNIVMDIPKSTKITQVAFFPMNSSSVIYPFDKIATPLNTDVGPFAQMLEYIAQSIYELRYARGSSNILLVRVGSLMGYQLSGYTYNPDIYIKSGDGILSNLTVVGCPGGVDAIGSYINFYEYHFPEEWFDERL